jgi:ATP-dependent helicase/nuclease subunit B
MTERPASVYTIAPEVSFLDALAAGLLARWGASPEELVRAHVFLPTRRACRGLRDAFLRATQGRPLLLPRMLPLGDLDADDLLLAGDESALGESLIGDLPPAIAPLRRQLLLARLILSWSQGAFGQAVASLPREDQAARLAAELARFLDQVETEGLGFDGLADLVGGEHAAHWQKTLTFLGILTDQWPQVQARQGAVGPAERRRRLLLAQAEAWSVAPPEHPVIVAGSTGSVPPVAELIAAVARLPTGEVVLPGVDRAADEASWAAIAEDPGHAQHGLARLLARLDLTREDVADWPWPAVTSTADPNRSVFLSWALGPAATTAVWHRAAEALPPDKVTKALEGVRRIDCATANEEAAVIALLMREALERPGETVALVTPDRALARRVAAELGRWRIEIDDSAGVPLAETPCGSFLRLTAQMAAGALTPVELLAVLKHPLAAGGLAAPEFRRRARLLELAVLRGPRPAPGFAGLKRALKLAKAPKGLAPWIAGLAKLASPFAKALTARRPNPARVVERHLAFAEALAASDEASGAERLWAQEAGEAAATFMAELREAAGHGPALGGEGYPAFLSALMASQVVRPRYGQHPRLAILGPLEARLQQFDLVILGGLNEGTWPAQVDPGPWLSRPMQADFGLTLPERRIGLSAHDFAQAFAAPRVVLTRAGRVEGTPTVPSRWLLRIDALLAALGCPRALAGDRGRSRAWAAALDRPDQISPAPQPAPRPPLEARPRRLSVTQVETWMRDPYALYARHVLGLKPLDPLDADPGAAERGTLVHEALEAYLRAHPEVPPADPLAALVDAGRQVFEPWRARPGVWAFWWPRYLRVAEWFAAVDRAQRGAGRKAWPEAIGRMSFQGPAGPFTLTAKADRIDRLADGRLAIVDYKTGAPPRAKDVEQGFAPQLPLEAAIAGAGGFEGVAAGEVAALQYWRLSGGQPPGAIVPVKAEPGDLAEAARTGLERLIACFDDPATAYPSVPRPLQAPRFNDYAHLARIKEWSLGGFAMDGPP